MKFQKSRTNLILPLEIILSSEDVNKNIIKSQTHHVTSIQPRTETQGREMTGKLHTAPVASRLLPPADCNNTGNGYAPLRKRPALTYYSDYWHRLSLISGRHFPSFPFPPVFVTLRGMMIGDTLSARWCMQTSSRLRKVIGRLSNQNDESH